MVESSAERLAERWAALTGVEWAVGKAGRKVDWTGQAAVASKGGGMAWSAAAMSDLGWVVGKASWWEDWKVGSSARAAVGPWEGTWADGWAGDWATQQADDWADAWGMLSGLWKAASRGF